MDADAYRQLQLDFVSGHTGSTELEVQLITTSIQVYHSDMNMCFN